MSTESAIAIDGPGAVGKTTVGRLLARRLGYLFIDTGSMYRALTWLATEREIDASDEKLLQRLAGDIEIDFVPVADGDEGSPERVMVNRRDLTEEIKQPEVDRQVSIVSKHPGVRRAMVSQQRRLAAKGDVVLAGRDIGTVVLPDARLKLYLTASVEERARRRHLELQALGYKDDYGDTLGSLKNRDKIDSERETSPLKPAEDATLVDTDGLSPDQVVDQILELWCPTSRGD
ncbi:MAG: (d)CMP kinase [Dehalococcoidia bacterium]